MALRDTYMEKKKHVRLEKWDMSPSYILRLTSQGK